MILPSIQFRLIDGEKTDSDGKETVMLQFAVPFVVLALTFQEVQVLAAAILSCSKLEINIIASSGYGCKFW